MSLLFQNRELTLGGALESIGRRVRSASAPVVTGDTALRHSGVWACTRLRADLVSTVPIDVFKKSYGVQIEMPTPTVLITPDGEIDITEWMYSSQFDEDRYGNTFGIISQFDGLGVPSRVELVAAEDVVVVVKGGRKDHFRIAGEKVDPKYVWHERQFTKAGLPIGLSPIAYAAWSAGSYLEAQEFALNWFTNDASPSGHLRNTLKPTINADEAAEVKARWKSAIAGRDVFVTGRDWEYEVSEINAATVMFIDQMQYGIGDICRFLGVPGDMIDADTTTGSITYANVTQRNLQLLTLNLGPVFNRRERALSRLTPGPRFVKFGTDALLRMDPDARSKKLIAEIAGRLTAPSEARALDNREPFTDAQVAEFDRLFGNPNKSTPQIAQGAAA